MSVTEHRLPASSSTGLEVLIRGEGSLSLVSYMHVLSEIRQSLLEVDRIALPGRVSRVEWGIRELSGNKDARIVLAPTRAPARRPPGTVDTPALDYVSGLQALTLKAAIPRYFSATTVQRIQRIGERIDQGAIRDVKVTELTEHREMALVDEEVVDRARRAVVPVSQAWSSISGKLDVLVAKNAARPRGEITLASRRGVLFTGTREQIPLLREAWGKSVIAGGMVTRNAIGQAIRLDLMELEIQDDAQRISAWDLLGIAPAYLGAMSSGDYVDEIRHA